jgi:hypothetical protein
VAVGFLAAFSAAACLALISTHRFFVASMIRFRPAALNRRFLAGAGASSAFLNSAHRFRCAAAIRFLPAAPTTRFVGASASEADACGGSPSI